MPSMAKSKIRPADAEAGTTPPHAKRRKVLPDARANGFDSILLANKANKKLAPAFATKPIRSNPSKVNDKNVSVATANGLGEVVSAADQKAELVEISSDSSSDVSDEEDEDEAEVNGKLNGVSHEQLDDPEQEAGVEEQDEEMADDDAEATFGERLQAQHVEPIDVEAALARIDDDSADDSRRRKQLAVSKISSGATFSTVLTQALNTNDNNLLESCFETVDLESVRETISRLDSRHIVSLLTRIAARISKRPGRLGNLMVWVQWSIIAHGGYLAGQPDIVNKLGTLTRIIKARADGLQPLLQLKGKLDMLSAQLDLRRDIQERNARDEEDEEGAVTVYVEGEEADEDISDEDEEVMGGEQQLLLKGLGEDESGSEDDNEDAGIGAFANGIVKGGIHASSDDSDDGEEEGLFDDEAEETDNDDGSEEDSEDDDDDSDDARE